MATGRLWAGPSPPSPATLPTSPSRDDISGALGTFVCIPYCLSIGHELSRMDGMHICTSNATLDMIYSDGTAGTRELQWEEVAWRFEWLGETKKLL